jgi:hypothetical protein
MCAEGPTDGEFVSLVNLITQYRQPELERIDPKNSLLNCRIEDNNGRVEWSEDFNKRFEGTPLNRALTEYHLLLKFEINRMDRYKQILPLKTFVEYFTNYEQIKRDLSYRVLIDEFLEICGAVRDKSGEIPKAFREIFGKHVLRLLAERN